MAVSVPVFGTGGSKGTACVAPSRVGPSGPQSSRAPIVRALNPSGTAAPKSVNARFTASPPYDSSVTARPVCKYAHF